MLPCFYLYIFENGFLNPIFDALSHTGIHKQTNIKQQQQKTSVQKGFTYIIDLYIKHRYSIHMMKSWESEFSIYCFTCTLLNKKIW